MNISELEKASLLALASRAILKKLDPEDYTNPEALALTENLKRGSGAFVSVYVKDELRGCIGTFSEEYPLYKNVENMAVSAATTDSRFTSIQANEYSDLELEISVLTPRKRIYDPSEIELGKHGIYLQLDSNRGTLLPQVAISQHWTVEEFLGNCSKYKAGIGWDGWKAAEMFTYEAIVFRSKAPLANC
jgi:AmmeMemoRadiSam system protein A